MLNIDITNDFSGLGKLEDRVLKIIDAEMIAFGETTVSDAKLLAPVAPDGGTLRNSISYVKVGLDVTIIAAALYAAYVEFGTRAMAAAYVTTLPSEWEAFAATFKSSSISPAKGSTPQPFLFPSIIKNLELLKTRLKAAIE